MKQTKKNLALLIVMAMLLMICACGEQSSVVTDGSKKATTTVNGSTASISTESTRNNIHTHSYVAKITDPTCTEKGYTTYTCDCGDSYIDDYTETIEQHIYVDEICKMCGKKLTNSEGLKYIGSGPVGKIEYYIVSGIGTCTDKEIVIPDTYNGLPVTGISNFAFYGADIHSIIISKNITSIGISAFSGCINLKSITIPGSVATIGQNAFSSCSGLKSITISDGVKHIELGAFVDCDNITRVTIPGSVTKLGVSAFAMCDSLESVELLNGVEYIDNGAFYGCSALTNISMPDSLKTIGPNAFSDCRNLTNITIPNRVGIPNLHPLKNNGVF